MESWWPSIGEVSLVVGSTLGLVWALFSTTRRRRKFLKAAIRPVGQFKWFLLSFLSMSCYLSLIAALGLASFHDLLPPPLFWFLLGLSAAAFATALLFPTVAQPRPPAPAVEAREPPLNPPILPVRKSA